MTKRFCDACGEEMGIDEDVEASLYLSDSRLATVAVEAYVSGTTGEEEADVCKHCLCDAFAKIDDRPGVAEGPDIRRVPHSIGWWWYRRDNLHATQWDVARIYPDGGVYFDGRVFGGVSLLPPGDWVGPIRPPTT